MGYSSSLPFKNIQKGQKSEWGEYYILLRKILYFFLEMIDYALKACIIG
jgi:hypothetical protein